MKILNTQKVFTLGFAVGVFIFALANSFSYIMAHRRSITYEWHGAPIGDGYGFPFTFYYVFGDFSIKFVWVEALANIAIGLLGSLLLGKICALISEHHRSRILPLD